MRPEFGGGRLLMTYSTYHFKFLSCKLTKKLPYALQNCFSALIRFQWVYLPETNQLTFILE